MLDQGLCRLLIHQGGMFDRSDPGSDGLFHPGGPMRMGGHPFAGSLRLLDGCPDFLEAELCLVRRGAGRQDAAGGDDLDEVRAGGQLLPNRADDLDRAVCFAPDESGMPARHADGLTCRQDSGSQDQTGGDRLLQREDAVTFVSDIANGRDACANGLFGVAGGLEERYAGRVGLDDSYDVRFAAQPEMDMTVDQARQHRHAAYIQVGRAAGNRGRAARPGGEDPVVLDHYGGSFLDRSQAVDEADVAERDHHPVSPQAESR